MQRTPSRTAVQIFYEPPATRITPSALGDKPELGAMEKHAIMSVAITRVRVHLPLSYPGPRRTLTGLISEESYDTK